jgi:hypothetical protein
MAGRRFPRPWQFEPIPGGYRVIDANGLALAHVYGEPPNAIAISDKRLTDNEAEKVARLIARLPELIELERDRNRARSRRKPQPLRIKPVTIGDLIKSGKLLEVHCSSCRPGRHLYKTISLINLPINRSVACSKPVGGIASLPFRMPPIAEALFVSVTITRPSHRSSGALLGL